MHRLQPVAHIGQRARHDHAHRVIEVGALHLLFDGDGRYVERRRRGGRRGQSGFLNSGFGQAETPAKRQRKDG